MITYIDYTDYSLLLEYICTQLGFQNQFEKILDSGQIPTVQKIKLQNIFEIEQYLASPEGFFESEDNNENFLIDVGNIDLIKNAEYLVKVTNDFEGSIYLYSSEIESTNAELKKSLKKFKIEIESIKKIDPNISTKIYQNYCDENKISLTNSQIKTLVEQTTSYNEIIDNLDFIAMSGDTGAGFQSLRKHQKPALFMQSFNLSNLDVLPWYKNVDDNELQLAISLIYGKLDKVNSVDSKCIQREIIYTDQKIKTSSKVTALTWFRLMLWKAKHI